MRLLTLLSLACGALALATGPVQPLTDSLAVHGGESLNLKDAAVAQEITRRDEEVSSSELDKREGFLLKDLWLPDEPNPANVVFAGVTISFIMATRYVMRQGRRVKQWYTESMHFQNNGPNRVAVQAMALGEKFFYSRLGEDGGDASGNPNPRASTYSLSITPVNDEL
ncbi:hypothetical protein E4U13_000492 [Claviceps humidiphila]|uniref:Uncharacterized protein n=2 Tax=Claviceps TaxID=5110 RepID=A0A9P7Q2M8_9HYPO|nr:hypothetical protein E4U56_004262 [Claviceps arundinis]KAG6118154.1 hypothetical protein E4U13_000492 [Claviceps humidiphila]